MRDLPASVWRLMAANSLMTAGTSLMVLIAGIIGIDFAPTPGLATLPIALVIVGVAAATLPTGLLQNRWGRRRVFIGHGILAIGAAALAAFSLARGLFTGFCAAGFLIGWSGAAVHQYRFAALEQVPAYLAPKATSALLVGGLLAAFVGPEIAVRGRTLLATEFTGSFVLLCAGYALGVLIISFNRDAPIPREDHHGAGRKLREILCAPVMIMAVCAAALSYGVMSFIMTATPISMHQHAGHSLESTKFVIQSHIAAMYLPSLAYARLHGKVGYRGMLWAGVTAYLVCLGVALVNTGFLGYWLALVLLGVGWNFLFLSGTNLLPFGYRPAERFRVQAANDFLVFSVQAAVALGSGWVLFRWGWGVVLWSCVPAVLAFAFFLARGRGSLPMSELKRDSS